MAASRHHDNLLRERKQALLGNLSGTIVEIGPGTGINFQYYPRGSHWIGIEPNPYMHPYLRQAGNRAGIAADIRPTHAEDTGLNGGCADFVVSTVVLCSVLDPAKALREVRRLLKPGGQFLFVEHVAAPKGTGLRAVQRVVRPFWSCLADGCNPVRATGEAIAEAGFRMVHMESFRLPLGPVSPHIAGAAVADSVPTVSAVS